MEKPKQRTAKPIKGDLQPPIDTSLRPTPTLTDDAATKLLDENSHRYEIQPLVLKTGNDIVYENRHNASIVLGRDYSYDKYNDTSIGMVDIACGRVGNTNTLGNVSADGNGSRSSGDFAADAARIYIAQKTDIDRMFGFEGRQEPYQAPVAQHSNSRSAVGIKADAIRLISRDPAAGISLVVEPDNLGIKAGENSQGGQTAGIAGGVSLIGSGPEETEMDWMVKAAPLADALAQMARYIQQLETVVWGFMSHQKDFNRAVADATDIEAFYASKGLPDPNKVAANQMVSLKTWVECEEPAKSINGGLETFKTNVLRVRQDDWTGDVEQIKPPKFASKHHKLN